MKSAKQAPAFVGYAWMSGLIGFGYQVPRGTLTFASGPEDKLRQVVSGLARHGYEPGTLLVPGCPEAADPAEAMVAFNRFMLRVRAAMMHRGVYEDAT